MNFVGQPFSLLPGTDTPGRGFAEGKLGKTRLLLTSCLGTFTFVPGHKLHITGYHGELHWSCLQTKG